MNGFFKPWRRKFGVVTLVAACVTAGGWVRSLIIHDTFQFPIRKHTTSFVETMNQRLTCSIEFHNSTSGASPYWGIEATPEIDPLDDEPFGWRLRSCGFGVGGNLDDSPEYYWLIAWQIPYWSIVVPLTLLSAWLLLSKPKQRKPSLEQQANT